jgi:hypothetical protein
MNSIRIAFTLLVAAALTGCATSRKTTTERTAVEQALLSQSGEATIAQLVIDGLEGTRFVVEAERFEAVDEEHLLAVLERRLIELGMIPASDVASAEIIVRPSVANAGIDDSGWFIGIPEIPFGFPGVGRVSLPEVVLLAREAQSGRNRMQVHALDAETHAPRFVSEYLASERHYNRWKFLFIFSFRRTNLEGTF